MNILVVDPEAEVRLLFFSASDEIGGEVYFAETDSEAIQVLRDEMSIGIALIAHNRGSDSGLRLARFIRTEFVARHIPVLFLSDESDTRVLVELLEYGDDVVIKPFSQAVLLAKLLAHRRTRQLYQQIEVQLKQLEAYRAQVDLEHQIAADVFSQIMARALPDTPGIYSFVSPFSSFNGDLTLVAARPGEGFHVLIADITGHGLSAALGTMPAAEIFLAMTQSGIGISEIAKEINRAFRQRMPDYLLCAAVLISVLDNGERMQIWSGGMPALLVLDDAGEIKATLPSQHMALGALSDRRFDARLETLYLQRGDRVLCYTDGITETPGADDGELFGEDRLLQTLAHSGKRGQQLVDHLVQSLYRYAGTESLSDDATIFCFDTAEYQGLNELGATANDIYAEWEGFVWQTELSFTAAQLRADAPLELVLSNFPPNPYILAARADLSVILHELFVNALDHGLLQLDSTLKAGAEGMLAYYSEREKRLAVLASGAISFSLHCEVNQRVAQFQLEFRDSGSGFDFAGVMFTAADASGYSGRGLRMVAAMCDEISANAAGNVISLRYSWPSHITQSVVM